MPIPKNITAGATGLLLLASTPLAAQSDGRGQDIWSRVSKMDKDGDGKVAKAEFTGPARIWERLDANKDGFATKAEATAMRRGGSSRGDAGRRGTAPDVGDAAPAVRAKAAETGKEIDLANPKKTTVLVFGSHT